MKLIELAGKRFGKLQVIEYVGKSKWKCECDCGNSTVVASSRLLRGVTKSCGCLKGTGIIGRKEGKLTVIRELGNRRYECVCECGNHAIRRYESIIQHAARNCDKCGKIIRTEALKNSDWYKSDFVDGTQLSSIGRMTKANKSGIVGVNWDKSRGKWQATIRIKGVKYNLGRFDNIEDAINARKKAEETALEVLKIK